MPASLCLVLHSHLPFVRHPEHDDFLEEDWLYEAITESYVPQLLILRAMRDEGLRFRLTVSLTPPLCEMLADDLLQTRYLRHIDALCELSEKEVQRRAGTAFEDTARHYCERFAGIRRFFVEVCRKELLPAYRELQDQGFLDIITCAATHGFLPFVATPGALRAQVKVGVENYRKHFGRAPRGIWLPECGWTPALDGILREAGLQYFIVDSHALLFGSRPPPYGIHAPACTPAGIFAFARDTETSRQVWSSTEGYPGDPRYREFYKDLGFEGEYEHVKPYLHRDGVRRNLGIKYHRVTGKVELHHKQPYQRDHALQRTWEHARHFLESRRVQAAHLTHALGIEPCVLSPYDAELFGHWWYEGPEFLDRVLRLAVWEFPDIRLISPSDYLDAHSPAQHLTPAASTWGDQGYNGVWLNESNEWIYRHLHEIERRMSEWARRSDRLDEQKHRILTQMGRECLLAQSSDWAFIMANNTTVPYAHKRLKTHVKAFLDLERQLIGASRDGALLKDLEARHSIFPELDLRHWR